MSSAKAIHQSGRELKAFHPQKRGVVPPPVGKGAPAFKGYNLKNLIELDRLIREGVPSSYFDVLTKILSISQRDLAHDLGIPTATLSRRKANGSDFNAAESDKLLRLARIYEASLRMAGNSEKASTWLRSPVYSLGNKKPIELAATSAGAEVVLDFIDGLEYGVFA